MGALRKGVERVADPVRRTSLLDWIETDLPNLFPGRILAVDEQVADRWGRMMAQAGRPIPAIDSLIAATAAHHELTLVTRNIRDFAGLGLELINPWKL